MPIPFALCGGEFTNLAARMQKTPALDHSTRGFTKRYKSAGYRYGRRASHPKPVEEWASAAKFPGNSMPPAAPAKVSVAPEDSKLRAPPGAGRKVKAKSVVERQLSAGRHPDRSDCKRPNLAACDRCCKRQLSTEGTPRADSPKSAPKLPHCALARYSFVKQPPKSGGLVSASPFASRRMPAVNRNAPIASTLPRSISPTVPSGRAR